MKAVSKLAPLAGSPHDPVAHDHTGLLVAAGVSALIWGAILFVVV